MVDWHKHAEEYYGGFQQPHPQTGQPLDIKVRDYPTAVKLATASKFGLKGGHADPKEAEMFWKEFQGTGLSPDQYLETLKALAPLSWRYHDRPPSIREVVKSTTENWDSKRIRMHYSEMPHEKYPEMSAGEYIKAHHSAAFYSNQHLGRDPYGHEVAHFHSGNMGPQSIDAHYRMVKDDGKPKAEGPQQEGNQQAEGNPQ